MQNSLTVIGNFYDKGINEVLFYAWRNNCVLGNGWYGGMQDCQEKIP